MSLCRIHLLFAALLAGSLQATEPAAPPLPPASPVNPATRAADLGAVLDAFLVDHAAENPAWRRDIRLGVASAAAEPPAGFYKAHSQTAGWYYYRAQNSETLPAGARREVFRDPRFLAFLSALRDRADHRPVQVVAPPQTSPEPLTRAEVLARLRARNSPMPEAVTFTLGPEELLSPQPIIVAIGAPAATS